MAIGKNRHDSLEAAKIGHGGEPAEVTTGKDQARKLVAAAAAKLPTGLPEDSPYAQMGRDALIAEGVRLAMPLGPILSIEENRLVLEYLRQEKITAPLAGTPADSKPMEPPPPVPTQPVAPRRKHRGVPESETGVWRVKGPEQKTVSLSGQITTMRRGAVIQEKHYEPKHLTAMVEQGIELEPVGADELE